MLCGLSDDYKSLIMTLEGKGGITLDVVKNVLLQNIDYEGGSESALSVQKKQFKKKKSPKCYGCGGPHYKRDCNKKENKSKKAECVLYSALATSNHSDQEWYIDSGATRHMTNIDMEMENRREPIIREVKVANNERVKINHVGDVKCKINDGENFLTLKEVQYIPDLCVNLLSVSQMVKNGNTVIFDINGCKILNKEKSVVATGILLNDMFKLNVKTNESACASANIKSDDSVLWHRRLAHTNFKTIKNFMNINVKSDMKCIVCAQGKQSRSPFNDIGHRATKILEIVHSDICGPFSVNSLGGCRYFLSFVDDFSRKVFVYPLKSKGEVFCKFIEFKQRYENETGETIKILRSDNGTEYVNTNFDRFFVKHGIKHERSAPYSPQQNGLAERVNRTIIEKVRCMLLDSKLTKQFWAEAVCAAVDIINMLPHSSTKTAPNELWNGERKKCQHTESFWLSCNGMEA